MQNQSVVHNRHGGKLSIPVPKFAVPWQAIIGMLLLLALFAFETFNFDSTRYAFNNLLGGVSFLGLSWAVILAVAFCAIDFAGLARLFTSEQGAEEPKEIWYLTGAWFLGATMNAIMTWWAVSLVLLNHNFGNEVLNRQQLLEYVPIFVAILVWLTRILFIGAFAMTGDKLFRGQAPAGNSRRQVARRSTSRGASTPRRAPVTASSVRAQPIRAHGAPHSSAPQSSAPRTYSRPGASNGNSSALQQSLSLSPKRRR